MNVPDNCFNMTFLLYLMQVKQVLYGLKLLDNVAQSRYIRDESGVNMNKTATVRARLEPSLKEKAEEILQSLGLSTTQAITLYYKQIEMNNGLPFDVVVPSALTRRTLDETDSGEGLILCEDAEDMFKKLGI
jgi:DNA-damage-inducible protein J